MPPLGIWVGRAPVGIWVPVGATVYYDVSLGPNMSCPCSIVVLSLFQIQQSVRNTVDDVIITVSGHSTARSRAPIVLPTYQLPTKPVPKEELK